MDLSTNYLGLKLRTPLVPSASPLSEELHNVKRMEDAGASAVVLYSLFEEVITHETHELHHHLTHGTESFAESLSYFPEPEKIVLRADKYLEHITKLKKWVDIPIIASLNANSEGGWTEYAKYIEGAGADALELNIYHIPTDMQLAGLEVEKNYIEILKSVKSELSIPVAVKLSPFFSNFANMAKQFDEAGADALVLFNRFYQPDIDLDQLDISPALHLSTSADALLAMRWISILFGRVGLSLAATGGVHTAEDALKLFLCGADVTYLCSTLLVNGPGRLDKIRQDVRQWLTDNEYESVAQLRGSLSQMHSTDPEAFERGNYIRMLGSYKLPSSIWR